MHLETYDEYSETYDRETVNACRDIVRKNQLDAQMQIVLSKGVNTNAIKRISEATTNLEIYRVMGERYQEKEETIQKWMKEDARKDVVEKNALPPNSVYCEACKSKMEVQRRIFTYEYDFEAKRDIEEVQFIFACPRDCAFQPIVHADGSPVIDEALPCPRCGEDLRTELKLTKSRSSFNTTCTMCDYAKYAPFDSDIESNRKDKHFSKDRAKYCMSNERGQQYVREILPLDVVLEVE